MKAETRIARARITAELSQQELAEAIGISLPTYRRLERNKMRNPPLRYIVNAAIALGLGDWTELVEPEWERWLDLRLPDDRRRW